MIWSILPQITLVDGENSLIGTIGITGSVITSLLHSYGCCKDLTLLMW